MHAGQLGSVEAHAGGLLRRSRRSRVALFRFLVKRRRLYAMPATRRKPASRRQQRTRTRSDTPASSHARRPTHTNNDLPDRDAFEASVDEYLASLHWTKQRKALLDRELYDLVLYVLRNPFDTSHGSDWDRHWIRTAFELGEKDGVPVPLRKSRGSTPCASREEIYDALTVAHVETEHGGRDKTFRRVKDTWSYIPKEIATRFVRLCPTCTPEGPKPPRLPVPPVEAPQSPPPASTSTSDAPYGPRFFTVPSSSSSRPAQAAQPASSFFATVLAFPTFPSSLPQPALAQSISHSPVYPAPSAAAGIGIDASQQTNPSPLSRPSAASQPFLDPASLLYLTAKVQPHEPAESTIPRRYFGRQIQLAATSSSSSAGYNSL
ncbi:hypothetical protein JCM10296v2_007085 [Rhodotorula toruloides]